MRIHRRKFCECGCGCLVKNRFVNGHVWIGRKHTEETKHKISSVLKVLRNTPESRRENSIAQNKPRTRRKRSDSLIKANRRSEVIARRSKSAKLSWKKKDIRIRRSQGVKDSWSVPGVKEKRANEFRIAHNNPETRKRHVMAQKNNWKNPKYIKKQMESLYRKPNKPETMILNLLNRMHPGEWKYTGDFSFIIGGKNPDFVNCNGQKKVIEFNGSYWHKKDLPGEREKIFAEYGYDTMIIWDHDLKDMERVRFRINRFMRQR